MNEFSDLANLLSRAEIKGAEAAPLFKVSRTAVYNWMHSGTGPHQEVLRMFAERQVRGIRKALEAGALPLRDVAPADRKKVLADVIRKFH